MKKVVVVGAGNWGKNLIKNFFDLEVLEGVADISPELRANVLKVCPGIKLYEDYVKVLDTEVSALVFATPAPTHYRFAMDAMKSGKDVFIEKPMTLSLKEAIALAEYADQHNRILMVGHLLMYQPAVSWMRDYLAAGKAGRVYHVATQRVKLGRVRREENVWWSFAPHDVSIVLSLLGNPKLSKVKASGHAILQTEIEDQVHVDLTFESGQTAHLHCSWFYPLSLRGTVVIAEHQMLVYDESAQKITIYNKGVDKNLNNREEEAFDVDIVSAQPLKLECEHFISCLETREQPLSNGWNGVAVVEVLERGQRELYG